MKDISFGKIAASKSILFVLNRFPGIGGIENVTITLANHFVRAYGYKDKKIHIYCLSHDMESCYEKISEIQQHEGITHVIYQDSYSPTLSLLDCFDRRKVKVIVAEHNTPDALVKDKVAEFRFEPVKSKRQLIRKVLFPYICIKNVLQVRRHHRKAYAKADIYVVLAKAYLPIVRKMVGNGDKLIYINNPLTIPFPKQSQLTAKQNEVLFVCRLTSQKGTDLILKVWERFYSTHPGWTLKIVGDGPERTAMERWVESHHLTNIVFEGFKTNIVPYYQQAKIVCITSRFEGWGLVLVEGMAYSCIPIAFKSYAAVSDIIDDGVDGFVVKPYDIDGYVRCLSEIANDRQHLESMQEKAAEKAKRFSLDAIGRKWVELLR